MPDIDLDFPRDIREKLIVRVTERYGHEHAALVASFATYRSRGAIRDVGKALGLPHAELERLARVTDGWHAERVADEVAALPDAERKLLSKRWRAFQFLTREIAGLPRHVSQHPGGMVISSRPLVELVPVQPAAMAGPPALPVGQGLVRRRRVPQDRPARARDALVRRGVRRPDRAARTARRSTSRGSRSTTRPCSPRSRRPTPSACSRSRAARRCRACCARSRRRSTTSRSRSRSSGPGRSRGRPCTRTSSTGAGCARTRRSSSESPHESLREPLAATLGVVVFQDQVLDVAIALAGFTIGEAEGLRRAMSRKRSHEALEAHRARFVEGAVGNGVDEEVADGVFDTLVGFSGFGFPKAHAAAFGLLAYQSAWLRHHYPAEFLCGAPERAADGLLPAREPRPRRAAARGRGAPARRQPERGALLAGALRRG